MTRRVEDMSGKEIAQRATIGCMKSCLLSIEANTTDVNVVISTEQQKELTRIYEELLLLQSWIVLGKKPSTEKENP